MSSRDAERGGETQKQCHDILKSYNGGIRLEYVKHLDVSETYSKHCDRQSFGHSVVNISMIFSPLSRTLRLVPIHPHKAGLSVYRQNRWSTSTTPEQEMASHAET